MEKKYVVPEGMLEMGARALMGSLMDKPLGVTIATRKALEAAFKWLAENPIVPTDEELSYMSVECPLSSHRMPYRWAIEQWQRRMFLAPEPEVPQGIKDLLVNPVIGQVNGEQINQRIIKAYERGVRALQNLE